MRYYNYPQDLLNNIVQIARQLEQHKDYNVFRLSIRKEDGYYVTIINYDSKYPLLHDVSKEIMDKCQFYGTKRSM